MSHETAVELAMVLALERELQTTSCRTNRARLQELVAPELVEVGAPGRLWNLRSTLKLLAEQSREEDGEEIEIRDLTGRMLADGFALVR